MKRMNLLESIMWRDIGTQMIGHPKDAESIYYENRFPLHYMREQFVEDFQIEKWHYLKEWNLN
jgi:hypothetical protein